jgi:3-hydroxyisobutyrate dehydrogenase-like beta-hydroxyacid dehydrogenase
MTLGGTDGDVAEATPVLEDLASRITHIGLAGARQLVKLVNQVLVGCGFAAITAAAMARAADLPPDRVLAAFSGGAGGLPVAPGVLPQVRSHGPQPTGRISNMVKDLETAREHARSANVPCRSPRPYPSCTDGWRLPATATPKERAACRRGEHEGL